jgi:hypothetical protein
MTSFARRTPTHEARVTWHDGAGYRELTRRRAALVRRLRRAVPGLELLWIWEWSDSWPHLHLTIIARAPGQLTAATFAAVVKAAAGGGKVTFHCARLTDPASWALYLGKTGRFAGSMEMPDVFWAGHLYGCTKGFLAAPLLRLIREAKAEWRKSRRNHHD